jgi:anaerobic dimethyl sulfoxide reductase subunit B (iron-sulfur subunit)
MTYAFYFDASACTGCKACQVACKDRNNLPVGVLWRRVIEVSGGEWMQSGAAWSSTVFAYNLSMACNHCVHPKCAGVCPTNAYHVREDGIVLLDTTKCMGCGYCNWACPYAVPQYNQASGLMSKCNFCFEAIDAGQLPACVAACPLRVLDFMEVTEAEPEEPGIALWEVPASGHPFPLPAYSRTQPHMRVNPHPAMLNTLEKQVANSEELRPQEAKSELPLVAFSLLAQLAVGLFWTSSAFLALVGPGAESLRQIATALVGGCLALGMLISFAHLGARRNAWRALSNLHKSWLSREILMMGLFGAGWLLSALTEAPLLALVTCVLGLGLICSMASIYRLRSMALWNSWRTLAGFLLSALLLGLFVFVALALVATQFTGPIIPAGMWVWLNCFAAGLLAAELELAFEGREGKVASLRLVINLVIMAGLLGLLLVPASAWLLPYGMLVPMLVGEQILGRWLFYAELSRRVL